MTESKLREELIQDEGLRLQAYQDSLGFWTIGAGHYLGMVRRMVEITEREADVLLSSDIDEAKKTALIYVPNIYLLSDARQRALVNMAFNLGAKLGQFQRFLKAVNNAEWDTAGVEMENSRWWHEVGGRAVRLRRMIVTGED